MKKLYLRATAVALAVSALLGVGIWRKNLPAPTAKKANTQDAAVAGVSEETLSNIRASLEKQEYHVSFDEKTKSLQSPNRAQNLRAYYQPGKLTVQTRVDTTGHRFKMELINEGVFADGKPLYSPQSNAQADPLENQVQISHESFTEEFVNNEDGIRQNFIVDSAPEGTRQLQVRMTAKGLKVEQGEGNELHFYSKLNGEKRNELTYNDLNCWDGNKKPLHATLTYVSDHTEINVDVADAAYPVTIDPIIANGTPQNANKVIEINQSSMWLGYSVSSAGDVNGDGYSDIIVGAPKYDKGQTDEGAAFVYPGTPNGLSAAAVTIEGNQDNAQMGYSVATAGDFNGDGFSDVLAGAPLFDTNGTHDGGKAVLYFGSQQGIIANSTPMEFTNVQSDSYYGISVATAGDIDADGYSDIILGASRYDFGQTDEGVAVVIYGAQSGNKMSQQLEADNKNAEFGFSVAPAGDVDGDGYSDVLVGARFYTNGAGQGQEGAAFVYRGSAIGLITNNPIVFEGNQQDANMGYRVSSAGDVNGDGYSDVLLSAYMYDTNVLNGGRAYLHLGSSTGLNPNPDKTYEGHTTDEQMGSAVACAGDVNGDGYADILIGAQRYDNGQNNEGAVFVFHGSINGVSETNYASIIESNQNEGWFGTAIASAGDVNGDGYSDILVGCYTFDNGQVDEGHVFLYHGSAESVGLNGSIIATNTSSASLMGFAVSSAGDVNADGYGDVVVGAPYFDNGQTDEGAAFVYYGGNNGLITATFHQLERNQVNSFFGGAVAGAGDVNGDGYDDVLIGAKEYTDGQSHEGAAFLYTGSPTGVDPGSVPYIMQMNIANSDFGFAVSPAGDVNRDGYADYLVGAPAFANTGNVFLYYGTGGLLGNPVNIPGPQLGTHFGEAIGAAGDVNGDGYADIVAGAWGVNYGQAGEGAVYIYHGAAGAIDANNPSQLLESNQVDANFGFSVAGAGDVNGDGYSDIIAGSRYHDHPESNEGLAIVYYGTNTGISKSSPAPTVLEANSADANFGTSVSSAGDVNGDGYSDVIVGAPNLSNGQTKEGKAFVFHGSPSGVKTTTSFSYEGSENNSFLGRSVAGAGDVNGDGFSDVIIGAHGFDNGLYADAGKVILFYGNNGKGLRNNIKLYNNDGTTPINHSQFGQVNFVAGLFAKSFIGINKGKLAIESKGQGTPFSNQGTYPITTSTQYSYISPNFSNLPVGGLELKASDTRKGIATKVRARVRYSPVLAITGQMYGPWRYVQPQLTGLNNAPVPEEAMAETIRKKAEPEVSEDVVNIFPNPASDRLSIQAANANDIRSTRLFNTSGKLVFQAPHYERDIDVSKLSAGVYILMLNKADGKTTSHRVLIRR